MFSSLKTRMILMVGIPVLLVNFGLLFISASQQQKMALKQAEDLARATTRKESMELQSLLDRTLSSASLAAAVFKNVNDMDNPLDMGRESASFILKGMLEEDNNFAGVFSVWEPDAFDMMDVAYGGLPGNSLEGRFSPYWESQGQNESVLRAFADEEISGESGWYKDIRQSPHSSFIWAPVSMIPEDSPRVLRAIAPIINDGIFLGVVGVDIGSEIFETMVAGWSNLQNETIVHLHTLDGALVAQPRAEISSHCGINGDQPLAPGIIWQDEKLVSAQILESSLAKTDLIVVSETSRSMVLGPIQKKLQKNVAVGLMIVITTLLFVGYFIKANIARVVQLSTLTRHVSLGENFDPVVDESTDEIGHLTRDFQSMIVSLQEAEDERLESLTRLEAILDSVQAGVVIIDPAKRTIVDVNPAALKMLGLPKDQVINKICHGFMCPAETDSCPILDLHQEVDGDRKVLLREDQSEMIIFKTVVPIELKGKTYLLETFVDVDKQVKAEHALEEKLAQISQAKKQQDILVNHAVSREERMVSLKTEVNDLRDQLDMPLRYKAPGEIEAWRRELAKNEEREHHETR